MKHVLFLARIFLFLLESIILLHKKQEMHQEKNVDHYVD